MKFYVIGDVTVVVVVFADAATEVIISTGRSKRVEPLGSAYQRIGGDVDLLGQGLQAIGLGDHAGFEPLSGQRLPTGKQTVLVSPRSRANSGDMITSSGDTPSRSSRS